MNVVWLLILISGTAASLAVDPDGAVTALLGGATNAVTLALTLVASYGFWLGFFKLLEASGAAKIVQKILRPLVRFLFPGSSERTQRFVTLNMAANLLGLGNASTPMGVSAINSMYEGKPYASANMITLVVISSTSLQLVPTTVIAMRVARGSTAPAAFLPASIAATIASTAIGIALVKLLSKILPAEPKPLPLSRRLISGKKSRSGAPV